MVKLDETGAVIITPNTPGPMFRAGPGRLLFIRIPETEIWWLIPEPFGEFVNRRGRNSIR